MCARVWVWGLPASFLKKGSRQRLTALLCLFWEAPPAASAILVNFLLCVLVCVSLVCGMCVCVRVLMCVMCVFVCVHLLFNRVRSIAVGRSSSSTSKKPCSASRDPSHVKVALS